MYKSVCVVGLGYIGLPTALLLAKAGLKVYGFDVDEQKLELLKQGQLPFNEHGLPELFTKVRRAAHFIPTNTMPTTDAYIVAVPTPYVNQAADLTYVINALKLIKPAFRNKATIIIESTIGPRDCEQTLIPIINKWQKSYLFAHCPERAIPGSTLHEMAHNDRIIGGRTRKEAQQIMKLYSSFVKGNLYPTTTTIAASVKVMENTYRATNIALANEFAQIAHTIGFDVWEAIELANKHPRVKVHQPGPGVGGHCIPIDPWFFVQDAPNGVIQTSLEKNNRMPAYVVSQLETLIKRQRLTKPTVGILGYAYKKNVDDSRETPAEAIYELCAKKYKTVLSDPYCEPKMAALKLPILSLKEVLQQSEVIVLVTDHDEFINIKFKNYPQLRFVYDTRNVLTPAQFKNSQAELYQLGNGA